jgi:RimJ/RimL family protein N-acetyltransferase
MISRRAAPLTLEPLDAAALGVLQSWFDDPELSSRYQRPDDVWLTFIRTDPGAHAWVAREGESIVGQIQLDVIAPGVGAVGFYVDPALRSRGYGRRVLAALLARPETARLRRIIATTEPGNVTSRRCLESAGFVLRNPAVDEEGFLTYEIVLSRLSTWQPGGPLA